jgi:hypothetical protein
MAVEAMVSAANVGIQAGCDLASAVYEEQDGSPEAAARPGAAT